MLDLIESIGQSGADLFKVEIEVVSEIGGSWSRLVGRHILMNDNRFLSRT
jgi:hypothetical protein